jgi:hypothetical protein
MRHPTEVRNEILGAIQHAMDRIRIRLSMYLADDLEVLKAFEKPQQFDLAEDLTRYTMEKLGHLNKAPSDPRFDKTRRLNAKRRGRPPKGLTKEERAVYYQEINDATQEA